MADQTELKRIYDEALKIQQQLAGAQTGVNTLQQAQGAGMAITPQSSVQQAQTYLGQPISYPLSATTNIPPATTTNIPPVTTTNIPPATSTSSTDVSAILASMGYGGTSGGNDYQKQLMDMLTKMSEQQTQYTDYLKSQPSATDIYTQLREKLGLPAAESRLTGLNTQIQKTEGLISQLETDIQQRSQGKLITQPQQNRQIAVEQRPLQKQLSELSRAAGIEQTGLQSSRDQLAQMLSLSGTEQERQAAIAKAPLEYMQGMLPTISELATYQSPEQQLAQQLALTQGRAQIEQQYATPETPKTTIIETNGRQLLIDATTGKTIQDLGPVTEKPTTTNTLTIAEAQKLGLPISLAGKTEQQVIADLSSSSIPRWFTDYINSLLATDPNRRGDVISPQEAQGRWDEFRTQLLNKKSLSSDIENPFQ